MCRLDAGSSCRMSVSRPKPLLFLVPVPNITHGAMGRRIDPSWGGPIELFLVPASAPVRVSLFSFVFEY